MFGSEEAARIIIRELTALPAVEGIVEGRYWFLPAVPRESAFPCVLVYPRITAYDMPINSDGDPVSEIVQMEVRVIDKSQSADVIRPAARAQMAHFANNSRFDELIEGKYWTADFSADSEIEMPHLIEGTEFYSQRGTVYTVNFSSGG